MARDFITPATQHRAELITLSNDIANLAADIDRMIREADYLPALGASHRIDRAMLQLRMALNSELDRASRV